MELCIDDLNHDCKDIESWIEIERSKLTVLRSELEDFANNEDIRMEKLKNRKREKEIEREESMVQSLISECNAFLKVIATVEKDARDSNDSGGIEEIRSSLNQVIAETELAEDEIYEVEGRIKQLKEENVLLEKERKKKLLLDQAEADKERERCMLESRSRGMEELVLADSLIGKQDLESLKLFLVKDEEHMAGYSEKVQQLREESEALYRELLNLKRDKEEFCDAFEKQQNQTLSEMTDEIIRAEGDIAHLESQLRDVVNDVLEKIEADQTGETDDKFKQREEEEAIFTLENLQRNVKNRKDQLSKIRGKVKSLQSQCKEEEKRNEEIILDLKRFEKLTEKMRREEEEAFIKVESKLS